MCLLRFVILFLFVGISIAQDPDVAFLNKIINFEKHWEVFIYKAFGCHGEGMGPENCNPKLGTIDYGAYMRSCKAALEMFELEKGQCLKVE